MVEFRGIEPPADDFPVTEFQAAEGLFDLYNCAKFLKLSVSPNPPTLSLLFAYSDDWRLIDESDIRVVLAFGGVSALVVEQSADYDVRAADTLNGVSFGWPESFNQPRSDIRVDLGDLTCTFGAESVALEVTNDRGREAT